MFVAIVGTRSSGKSTIENYLVLRGFQRVRILDDSEDLNSDSASITTSETYNDQFTSRHLSFLSLGPVSRDVQDNASPRCFSSPTTLLDYVTRNWRTDFVIADVRTREILESFALRPFFFLLCVDAPLFDRFQRFNSANSHPVTLEDFVRDDDSIVFGTCVDSDSTSESSVHGLRDLITKHVSNTFPSVQTLESYLEDLNILDPSHLRPQWDQYFMTLASLASQRSNCMKRRVGAVLVRENRILATGYNGTPRGVRNCNEGGCIRCNGLEYADNECVCLHAEENALLEAGRERVGHGSVLYCNTCPCLKCTIKIIQTGVRTVVYNLSYKVDDASARLLAEAGVELRRFQPGRPYA